MQGLTGTMHSVSSLLFGSETDGGPEADDGGPLGLFLRLSNGVVNCYKVAGILINEYTANSIDKFLPVTIVDVEDLPAVGLEALLNILGEGNSSVTIDGDV